MSSTQKFSRRRCSAGFSLIEVLGSIAVMLTVCGAIFSALLTMQRTHSSTMSKAELHSGVRGTTELLIQEIGQAGALPSASTALVAPIVQNNVAQPIVLGSNASMFTGENLLVDTGGLAEIVTLTGVGGNTVTAAFTLPHAQGSPVQPLGVFPQGILSTSTATKLDLLGDLNNDGTLVLVEYTCDTNAGTLKRSITPITQGAKNVPDVLMDNLVANPGGAPCFAYATPVVASGFTFIPSVGLTLSNKTAVIDPLTGNYATETKSFLNLAPRNVLAGLKLAQNSALNHLQPTPANLPQ